MGQSQSAPPKRPVTDAVRHTTHLPTEIVRVVISYSEATLSGRLFALGGGVPSNGHLTNVESLDPRINKWIRLADLQYGRFGLTALCLNDRMYAIGGIIKALPADASAGLKQTPTATVECYNPETGEWQFVASMQAARVGATASVHFASAVNGGHRIVVCGGSDCASRYSLQTCELYDPRTDRWSPLALPPVFVRDSMAVGGWRADETLTAAARLLVTASAVLVPPAPTGPNTSTATDTATATATATATPASTTTAASRVVGSIHLLTPRSYAVSAVIGHRLYVVGGTTGEGKHSALATGEMFDLQPSSESIAAITSAAAAAAVTASLVPTASSIAVNVQPPTSTAPTTNASSPDSKTSAPAAAAAAAGAVIGYGWTPIASMSVPRSYFAGAVVDGRLIVTGGADSMYGCTTEAYDPVTNTWKSLGLLCRHHARHGAATVNGSIYLSGGRIIGVEPDGRTLVERWNPINSSNASSKDGKGNGKGKWEDDVTARLSCARASHAMCAALTPPPELIAPKHSHSPHSQSGDKSPHSDGPAAAL